MCFWILKPYLSPPFFNFPRDAHLYEGAYEIPVLIRVFSLPFPVTGEQLYALHFSLFIVAGLACVGVVTRLSVFLTGFLQMYLDSITTAASVFNHEISLNCQILMFLAFAPGVTSLSLDRVFLWTYTFLKKRSEPFLAFVVGPPPEIWGTRLILILLAVVYFSAGVSKIRFGGWRWLDGQTLVYYLSEKPSIYKKSDIQRFFGDERLPDEKKWKDGFGISAHHYGKYKVLRPERRFPILNTFERKLGEFITRTPGVILAFTLATMVFELAAPLLLLGGWYRNIILIVAIMTHQTIGLLMGLPFFSYQIICFLMLDWELIIKSLRGMIAVLRRKSLAA